MRVVVAGGGSGGHVLPGLAVIEALRVLAPDTEIAWLGSYGSMEERLVRDADVRLLLVHAGKLNRFVSAQTVRDVAKVPLGCVEAFARLRTFRPDAVLTTGGYVAVPAGVATRLQGLPLLVHQQDVVPNLANRLLAPFATTINVTFAPSRTLFNALHIVQEGNPVRETLFHGDAERARALFGFPSGVPIVLVTGGSQGARGLNTLLFQALPRLVSRMVVIHACGEKFLTDALRIRDTLPASCQVRYVPRGFLGAEMADALAAATLVLGRAGASTLSELAVLGKPGVLVPLPAGWGGSPQRENARYAERMGAAVMAEQSSLTGERLADLLLKVMGDQRMIAEMQTHMRALGKRDAAGRIAARLLQLAA